MWPREGATGHIVLSLGGQLDQADYRHSLLTSRRSLLYSTYSTVLSVCMYSGSALLLTFSVKKSQSQKNSHQVTQTNLGCLGRASTQSISITPARVSTQYSIQYNTFSGPCECPGISTLFSKKKNALGKMVGQSTPSLIASLPGPSQHAGPIQSSHAVENRVTNGRGLSRGERGNTVGT